jgi:TonB family protein
MMPTAIVLQEKFRTPSVGNAFTMAFVVHAAMFLWNPILLRGGGQQTTPFLMQVEYRDTLPPPPAPVAKKPEPKPVVKKSKKSGISLAHQAPVAIHPVKRLAKAAPPPAPKTRISAVKMPKFVPHASDEELAIASRPTRVAQTTSLRPAAAPTISAPKLRGKTRGVRMADVQFELTERGGISGSGGHVVAIPIGSESGETASIASAPQLHDLPAGRHTSGSHYQAPLGDGVGELAGKNRKGYVGAIQVGVGEPSEEEVLAAGTGHGSSVGKGVEIGGPVGDRKIMHRKVPEYPAWAEEKGISALVKIFFTVRADGSIRRTVRVVHSSGYTELDQLAKEALLDWRFSPTQARSTTEEAWGVITFRFTLA